MLTEAEYGKGLALFQEQNLEIVVVCLHDQNARRKKKYEISVTTFTIITLYGSQLLTSVIQANIQ